MANSSIKPGMFNINSATTLGTGPGGDTVAPIYKSAVYIPTSNAVAEIAAIRAAGMTVFANLADARAQWTDLQSDGFTRLFNMTKYEAQIRRWTVAGGATQAVATAIAAAIADKTFIVYLMDEPNIPVFGGSIPKSVQNSLGLLVKSIWPGALTCQRSSFANMNPAPTGGWTGLDYGWSQAEGPLHVPSNGKTISQFYAAEMAGFATIDVGCILGYNWMDGGDGRNWDYLNNGSSSGRITGLAGTSTRWLASPDEIRAAADAAYNLNSPAWLNWTHVYPTFQPQQPWLGYELRSDFVAAFDYACNKFASATPFTGLRSAKGVTAEPGTGGGSGSAPSWVFPGVGTAVTDTNAASFQVPIPQGIVSIGDLLVMQVYSNNGTARSPSLPAGWTEAQRIDGTSVTGGHMVAFKVATSTEAVGGVGEGAAYVTVSFSGAGVAGVAQVGRMAVFRGNNTTQASVLGAVGPDTTWVSQENLGVITGFTPLDDDALVLVFGGRQDDLGVAVSPTYYQYIPITGDLTWAEMWHSEALGSAQGKDAGILANYGIISGTAGAIADKTFVLNPNTTASVTQQGLGTQTTGTGAVSPPWPTHLTNDIGLLFVQTQGGEAAVLSDPQGFTELTQVTQANGTGAGSTRLTIFWARATSSTMAAPTVADSGDHQMTRIVTFRNCVNVGTPFDIASVTTAATGTAVSIPGGTTTGPNERIVLVVAHAVDSASSQVSGQTNADLTAITETSDSSTSNGTGGGFCVTHGGKAIAGAFGATTMTLATTSVQVLVTLALKPTLAAGAGNGFMVSFKRAAFTAPSGGTGVPVLAAITPITVNKGLPVAFTAVATGGNISYTVDSPPVGPTMNISSGAFAWTPDVAGIYNITVRAANGLGSDAKVATITVVEVSPFTPDLTAIGNRQVIAGNTLTFTATATNPNSGLLQYSLGVGAPASAVIDVNTGVFVWATTEADLGDHPFAVVVDDGVATTLENIVVSVIIPTATQTYAVFAQEDLALIRTAVTLALNIRQLNASAEEQLLDLRDTVDQALDYVADVVATGQVGPR